MAKGLLRWEGGYESTHLCREQSGQELARTSGVEGRTVCEIC